jgi:hypothetical protein
LVAVLKSKTSYPVAAHQFLGDNRIGGPSAMRPARLQPVTMRHDDDNPKNASSQAFAFPNLHNPLVQKNDGTLIAFICFHTIT